MVWTTNPTRRNDILFELFELLDSSGNYTGAWLETAGITRVRVVCSFNGGSPTLRIDEGQYDAGASGGEPRVMRSQTVPVTANRGYAELDITTRYLRLAVSSGLGDNPFGATVRSV